MNPAPDTPEPKFQAVPGHTRLFRREGGTYYLRAKVPVPLRPIVGKTEIRKSLNTKTLKEALPLVKVESLRVDRILASAEAKVAGRPPAQAKLSREEIAWIVQDWFVKQEASGEQWTEQVFRNLSEAEQATALEEMKIDGAALNGSTTYLPDDGSSLLDSFLEREGAELGIAKGSEDYRQLLPLFRRAKTEQLHRSIEHAEGRIPRRYDPTFAHLDGQTIMYPRPRQSIAFGKFLDDFMDYQRKEHTETTPNSYRMAVMRFSTQPRSQSTAHLQRPRL